MSTLLEVIRAHIPRDRHDEDGDTTGTVCGCGQWEGNYFADGEAGPFDEHLRDAIEAWMRRDWQERYGDTTRSGGQICTMTDPYRRDFK